jgi:hypothetical protein
VVVGKEKGKDFDEVVQTNKKERMKKNTEQNKKMRCVFFYWPCAFVNTKKTESCFFLP